MEAPLFLKISDAANLGIHALVYMAERHGQGKPVATAEAAEAFKVSANHLSKVLQRLTRAGLVKSIRGPRGGFVLARDPDRINLHEIYEAIDGEIAAHHRCVLGKKACSYKECVFGSLVDDIQQKVSTQFLASTLDKLIHR